MTGDPSGGGFELLAEVRRLERRLEGLEATWRAFHELPTEAGLREIRRALVEAREAIDGILQVHPRRLDERTAPGQPAAEGETRPPAREIVRASRALDGLLARAATEWGRRRDAPDRGDLAQLARLLQKAKEQAATLRAAIEATGTGAGRGEFDEPAAVELDSLLWRIRSDWQHLRTGPAPDRAAILEEELDTASALAGRLAQSLRRPASPATPRGEHRIRFLPYRDGFTDTYNRAGFDALASAELKRCRRYGRPFGLILIELRVRRMDRLHGIVKVAREQLRAYDLLSRYVDRLFVAGLPESSAQDTRRIADRILTALRSSGFAHEVAGVTCATLPDDGETLSSLFQVARDRLTDSATPS